MKRWFKRIALTIAGVIGLLLLVIAIVAWRATRVPAWYATAVDQTPADTVADAAINQRFVPLQNWLARTSTGDLAARTDAEKSYTLDLTQTELNALLAKVFDNIRGDFETYRVQLLPGEISLAATYTPQGRAGAVTLDVVQPPNGLPTVAFGGLKIGNQPAPMAAVKMIVGDPAAKLRGSLQARWAVAKPPRIDDQDAAPGHTAEAYYGRLLLEIVSGRAVSPYAFLTGRLQGDDWVATRITQLVVADGKLSITFRMITPEERATLLAEVAGPLPGS
ncbi:MAG: hypothetical protein JWM57_3222 [Phycisphaerales bacterium]|nr:hypothetical protein [Phycisphaerales bacterium]